MPQKVKRLHVRRTDIDEKGMKDINKAINLNPNNYFLLNHRAAYYEKNKMYEQAFNDASKSIKLNKNDNVEGYYIRGIILIDQENLIIPIHKFI